MAAVPVFFSELSHCHKFNMSVKMQRPNRNAQDHKSLRRKLIGRTDIRPCDPLYPLFFLLILPLSVLQQSRSQSVQAFDTSFDCSLIYIGSSKVSHGLVIPRKPKSHLGTQGCKPQTVSNPTSFSKTIMHVRPISSQTLLDLQPFLPR